MSVEDKLELSKMIANELKSAIETNYKKMNDLLLLCEDNNDEVVRLTLKNLSEVFCDVLPSYKIREEEKKEEAQLSKEVKKLREQEAFLLSSY